jgi:phosphate-selective porin OprO and OprP
MRYRCLQIWLTRLRECLLALATAAACVTATNTSAQPPVPAFPVESPETLVPPEPAPADPWAEINELRQRLDQLESSSARQKASDAAKKAADAKKPTVKWSGQLQADQLWFNQDAANQAQFGDIENGAVIRRARMAMLGDYGPVDYRIEFDFALAGRPTFLDVWAGYKGLPVLGRVRVGHFFEPFSLERLTANRFQTYMDRSQVDQAFAPSRNLGVAAGNTIGEEESGTWALGLYRTNSNVFGDDVGDRFESSATGRVTLLPWYENDGLDLLHLGFASSYRYTDNGVARFAAGPEVRLGAAVPGVPNFIDTGPIAARTYQLLGWEVAWVRGPFSLQSEFVLTPVDSDF